MDRSLVLKATSSDSSATPGYMYNDIAKMTLGKPEVCRKLEDLLIQRLGKKDRNVKYKTLLVIKVRQTTTLSSSPRSHQCLVA